MVYLSGVLSILLYLVLSLIFLSILSAFAVHVSGCGEQVRRLSLSSLYFVSGSSHVLPGYSSSLMRNSRLCRHLCLVVLRALRVVCSSHWSLHWLGHRNSRWDSQLRSRCRRSGAVKATSLGISVYICSSTLYRYVGFRDALGG